MYLVFLLYLRWYKNSVVVALYTYSILSVYCVVSAFGGTNCARMFAKLYEFFFLCFSFFKECVCVCVFPVFRVFSFFIYIHGLA